MLADGGDYQQLVDMYAQMEQWDSGDKRPMIAIAKTTKGYWPGAANGQLGSVKQIISYASHPYAQKMNSEYFVALAQTFENRYGVEFAGIRNGAVMQRQGIFILSRVIISRAVFPILCFLRVWPGARRMSFIATV